MYALLRFQICHNLCHIGIFIFGHQSGDAYFLGIQTLRDQFHAVYTRSQSCSFCKQVIELIIHHRLELCSRSSRFQFIDDIIQHFEHIASGIWVIKNVLGIYVGSNKDILTDFEIDRRSICTDKVSFSTQCVGIKWSFVCISSSENVLTINLLICQRPHMIFQFFYFRTHRL
ncbi:Uncharacterised protein [Mycobacterium tuberculosis]|nr:Uncharacterised protein [Mycobacterium tuberculosis]